MKINIFYTLHVQKDAEKRITFKTNVIYLFWGFLRCASVPKYQKQNNIKVSSLAVHKYYSQKKGICKNRWALKIFVQKSGVFFFVFNKYLDVSEKVDGPVNPRTISKVSEILSVETGAFIAHTMSVIATATSASPFEPPLKSTTFPITRYLRPCCHFIVIYNVIVSAGVPVTVNASRGVLRLWFWEFGVLRWYLLVAYFHRKLFYILLGVGLVWYIYIYIYTTYDLSSSKPPPKEKS